MEIRTAENRRLCAKKFKESKSNLFIDFMGRQHDYFSCMWILAVPFSAIPTDIEAKQAVRRQPNIILFMVDDMGWEDSSVPFWNKRIPRNDMLETPNMEKLAAQGMVFSQAYATPISSPSRCSLLTGANAARHRVTNWTLEKNKMTDEKDEKLAPPIWNMNGVSPVRITENAFYSRSFVQILRDNGYHTIHCGKAHWGAIDTPGEDPIAWGFDVNIAGHAGGGPATYLSERNFGYKNDGTPTSKMAVPGLNKYWGTGTFLTEALTKEALVALDKAKKYRQPFFLYMSHYAIHVPIDRDERYFSKYLRKGFSEKEAAYASLIEGMDKSLGDIMAWLDKNGEADNTIIIFTSDNGGYATGSYWRDEPLYMQNAPLRSGKGSLYEGGIREPMIVKWKGVVRPQSRCDAYVIIEDFYPTLLEMAGVRHYKTPQNIDGISFIPLLNGSGNPSKNRAIYWNMPNIWDNSGPGISLNCAVRWNNWKLIYSYKTGKKELYNIADDIGEEHDLSASNKRMTTKLSRMLGTYLRKVKAQRPVVKATGKPVAFPDE